MIDVHSAGLNELSIYRFLFFALWLIVFQFAGDSPWFSNVSLTKNKVVQKRSNSQRRCAMSWDEWKINFPSFFWVMADCVYYGCVKNQKPTVIHLAFFCVSPTKCGQIHRKDAQWAETNEKSIFRLFRFLVFEIWSILYWNSEKKSYVGLMEALPGCPHKPPLEDRT